MNQEQPDIGSKILSLISHKLRTPLSIINGYSDAVLLQKDKEKISPFALKAVEEINKQGRNLAGLVDRLLLFGKADALQNADVTKDQIDLKKAVLGALNALAADAQEPQKELLLRGDKVFHDNFQAELSCIDGIMVMANENLLKAAIKEIADNAVKFNKNPDKTLRIYCSRNNNTVSISVKDNGAGIRPGDISRIFERFYQVDEFFTGQVEGWGLGLPFVKKVMDLHGGTISVVSDKGLGSVFTLTIPI